MARKSDLRDVSGKRVEDLLRQRGVHGDPSGYKEMKRLFRMMDQLLRVKKLYPEHTDQRGAGGSASRQQLCVVKARIGKTVEGHRKFLKEYLPQENKDKVVEKPELFGAPGEGDPASAYEKHMTGKHFKFIISPENQRVDIEALVRTLVKRVEKVTGHTFRWVAAVHADTAHKHAHLLINGTDAQGKDIYFDRVFITQTMREMTRQICTAMTGPRTEEEIRQSLSRIHQAMRYTSVDEEIKNLERPYQGEDRRFESRADAVEDIHYKRLCFLAGIGLAEQDGRNKRRFYLETSWKSKLKTQGRYNSYLAARQSLLFTSPWTLEQFTGASGVIEGQITKLYKMNDEDQWNHAMVIENKKLKRSWYVPLYFEAEKELLGTTVQCWAAKNQKGQIRPKIRVLRQNEQRRDI
jgi:hypothetical protein